jgi:peptide/nickel transport system permease protein
MVFYFIRRFFIILGMLVLASFLIYGGLEIMPGDAVSFMADPDTLANMDPAMLENLREGLGLNDPFIVRYFNWLTGVLHGDFGYSLTSGVPIKDIVFDTLPATVELAFASLLLSSMLGTLLGIISALKKGSLSDGLISLAGLLGLSVPQFFFGMVGILLCAIRHSWLPVGGRIVPGDSSFVSWLSHLILPASVLGLAMTAGVMRYARSSMLAVANEEFMRTARSKGLGTWRINFLHGFRVAMSPVIVLIGLRLPTLIGGSVVIEQVFQWPGIGSTFLSAIRGQNYPLVMMIAFFMVLATMVSSFAIDLITAMLDPRIRLS